MRKQMQKVFSLLLVLVMVMGMLPMNAFATETEEPTEESTVGTTVETPETTPEETTPEKSDAAKAVETQIAALEALYAAAAADPENADTLNAYYSAVRTAYAAYMALSEEDRALVSGGDMVVGMYADVPQEVEEADTVTANVAQIEDAKYETLAAAIEAANSGDTIVLLANADLTDSNITISKALCLNLGDHTLTGLDSCLADGYTTFQKFGGTTYANKIFVDVAKTAPEAVVTELTGDALSITTINNTGYGSLNSGGTYTLDVGYVFKAPHDEDTVLDSQYSAYHADFVVYADRDIPANTIALAGQYDAFNTNWVALSSAYTTGTEIRLLQALLPSNTYINYKGLCETVKQFKCGAMDISENNALVGTTLTVELRLYPVAYLANGNTTWNTESGDPILIGKYTYTFGADDDATADTSTNITVGGEAVSGDSTLTETISSKLGNASAESPVEVAVSDSSDVTAAVSAISSAMGESTSANVTLTIPVTTKETDSETGTAAETGSVVLDSSAVKTVAGNINNNKTVALSVTNTTTDNTDEGTLTYTITLTVGETTVSTLGGNATITLPAPSGAQKAKVWYLDSSNTKTYLTDTYNVVGGNVTFTTNHFSTWGVEQASEDATWTGSGTADAPYVITTEAQLTYLAAQVNNGKTTYSGVYFQLANDIALTEAWPGIGVYSKTDMSKAFQGTFDGNGKTISNVAFSDQGTADDANNYRGLFNQLYNATVKNLTVSGNIWSTAPTSDEYGGALIAGHAAASTITGCTANGSVDGTHNVAGIVVRIQSATIENCTNNASLSGGYSKMGGIVNISQYQSADATNKGSLIANCTNTGTITSTAGGSDGVGGIIGYIGYGDDSQNPDTVVTIRGCENKGSITGTDSAKIGQIVGYGASYLSAKDGNKGLSTQAAISNAQPGLSFATVTDGVATYTSTLESGKTYLVTASGATYTLKSGESITFDTSLATVTVSAAPHLSYIQATDFNNKKLITYTAETAVAMVTKGNSTTYYATLQAAITGASSGSTVTLLSDVSETGITIASDDALTIDLGGKTVTGDFMVKGRAIICNGAIVGSRAEYSTLEVNGNSGDLTLNNLTVTSLRHAIRADGGKLTVNSGSYTVQSTQNTTQFAINASTKAAVVINGGTFTGVNDEPDMGDYVIGSRDSGTTVTINGGTFKGATVCLYENNGEIHIPTLVNGVVNTATFDQCPREFITGENASSYHTCDTDNDGMWIIEAHVQGDKVNENTVAAKCETAGSHDEVVYCAHCKAELSRTSVTDAAIGHSWNEGVHTDGTTEANGYTTYTCKNDSTHTKTEQDNPSTQLPAGNNSAYANPAHSSFGSVLWGEYVGSNSVAIKSFTVKVYSGETLIATTVLNNVDNFLDAGTTTTVSWHTLIKGTVDNYWTTTWESNYPTADMPATKIETIVNDVSIGTIDISYNHDSGVIVTSWTELPGVKLVKNTTTGVYYETLQNAVDAAEAGATVQLLADVNISTTVTVSKKLTLDLNGKTISNSTDIWNDAEGHDNDRYSLISVKTGGELTVTGNGTMRAKENDCYALDTDGGTLTIENGTYIGNVSAVYVHSGSLTINGGSFDIQQQDSYGYGHLINCYDSNYTNNTASVTIAGGSFKGFNPGANTAEGDDTSFLATGYIPTATSENGSTVYTAVYGYYITVSECANGSISVDKATVAADAEDKIVTINVTPGEGYELHKLTVTTVSGEEVEITEGFGAQVTYTFTAKADTTVTATFIPANSVASIEKNGSVTYYTDVQTALDETASGDTVTLVADVDDGSTVLVPAGVTLDLGEYTLTASYVVVFEGGYLTANPGTGKLAVDKSKIVLPTQCYNDSTYDVLPIYNGTDGYVFTWINVKTTNSTTSSYQDRGLTVDAENNSLKFKFVVDAASEAKTLLANGVADNAFSIVVRLTWTATDGDAYQDFVFNEDAIQKVYGTGGYDFYLNLTGYDKLGINLNTSNLQVYGMVITDSGAVSQGTVYTANAS